MTAAVWSSVRQRWVRLRLHRPQGGLRQGQLFVAPGEAKRSFDMRVLNTAFMTITSGVTLAEASADREFWGRLMESAPGAHLNNAAMRGECTVHYWCERNREVDFVVQTGRTLTAIEVKSGRPPQKHAGTAAFHRTFHATRTLLVGGDGMTVEEFLSAPGYWTGAVP